MPVLKVLAVEVLNTSPPITRTVTQVFPVKIVPENIFRYCSRDVNMGRDGKGIFYFHYFKKSMLFLQNRRMQFDSDRHICLINRYNQSKLLSPAYEIGRGILKWRCPSVRPSFRPSVLPSVLPSVTCVFSVTSQQNFMKHKINMNHYTGMMPVQKKFDRSIVLGVIALDFLKNAHSQPFLIHQLVEFHET